jgi:hypothetical protein
MRKIYVVFFLLVAFFGDVKAQVTYDWLNTAPDGNWRQGSSGARWNPGGLFNEPAFGVLRFDNNHELNMNNNVAGTYNQFMMVFAAGNTNTRTIGGNPMRFFDFSGNNPKIENFSSANHVVNIDIDGDGDAADPLEINFYNTGNLTFNGAVNNRGSFINLFGTTLARTATFNGVISGNGGFGVNQGQILVLDNINTYAGNTEVNRGELWINTTGNAIANNNIFIGNGTALADVSKIFLSRPAGGTNFTRNFTINPGNATTRFIGSLNTSGTNEFSGVITNNTANGLEVEVVSATGTLLCSNDITGTSNISKIGAGVLEFGGTTKSYTGTTIVNSGVLRLAAANQINDASRLQLNAGTFSTGATTGFSETLGPLQLTANSTIALGSGAHNLTFSASNSESWTAGATLTITGWNGTCDGRIYVGTNNTGLTATQLAQITFSGFPAGAYIAADGEILPYATVNTASVSIAASPAGAICAGTNVTFTATPTNGGTAPTYQWKLNGTNVGTGLTTYSNAALVNGDVVTVEMASNVTACLTASPVTATAITMTVNPALPASVSIAALPAGAICTGTNVTFTATPTNGGTAPTYQWKLNGTNVGTGLVTYDNATLVNGDVVTVEMTSNATPCLTGSPATSAGITMTVNPLLPASVSIAALPAGAICAGTSVTFTATPTNGGATPVYQWKLNGTNVGTGLATYSNAALANGDVVTVEMTSNATPCLTGSPATSAGITMTVNPIPTVAPITGANNMPVGGTTTYTSATAGGTWSSASTAIATIDPSTGVITGVSAGTSVISYTVTVSGCTNVATKIITVAAANVWVSSTGLPANDAGYSTVKLAFDAINVGTHTGVLTATVYGNTTETATAAINASGSGSANYTSLSIQPNGARTVSGTLGTPLLSLNGADNVTINGLNTGGNSLTISNLSTANTANTSTIHFQADATSNTLTNCTILGSSTSPIATIGGTITFTTGTTTGNDNNTISNCNIGPAGTNLPRKAIYFGGSGTGAASTINNSGNVITNNNIYDYFGSGINSTVALYLTIGTGQTAITNNRFYQTALRTFSSATDYAVIQIANPDHGHDITITGNTIGFATNTGTGTSTYTAGFASKFYPILFNGSSTALSTISNNTIAGIAFTTSSSVTASPGIFSAIRVDAGLVDIENNIVGTAAGNIAINTATGGGNTGIFGITSTQATGTTKINNNTISNISGNASANLAATYGFVGINTTGASSVNISGNTIGGATADNIRMGVAGTSTGNSFQCRGIISTSTGTTTITNNVINNISVYSTSSAGVATNLIRGIETNGATVPTITITGNTVSNIKNQAPGVGTGGASAIFGIYNQTATATVNISNNNIFALSNTNLLSTAVTGIRTTGGAGSFVNKNKIHSLNTASTVAGTQLQGIQISGGGNWGIANNMVRLGIDEAGAAIGGNLDMQGISAIGSTTSSNVYHNSVYLGGAASGAQETYAIRTGNTDNVKNNIIVNRRTSATANTQIGLLFNGAGATLQDANLYFVNAASGGLLAKSGTTTTNYPTLATLQGVALGRDVNSVSSDPQFINATGSATTVDLHINTAVATQVESGGLVGLSISDDIDGDVRCPGAGCGSASTNPDLGADEINKIPNDILPPVILLAPFTTCSASDIVISNVIITDFTGVPTTGALMPRIYFRKNSDTWFSAAGTLSSGNGNNGNWTFTITNSTMGGVAGGDVISYYVIAQDLVATPNIGSNTSIGLVAVDVNTVTSAPTTPNSYNIINNTGTMLVGPTAGARFPSITAAINSFITCGYIGNVILELQPAYVSTVETFPIDFPTTLLSSSTKTITIRPQAGATPTIVSSSTVGTINFNGGDYIIFDGRPGGTGTPKSMTIENTSTVGYVVRYVSDATNNTIQHCTLRGVNSGATGNIWFAVGTTVGNDNNIIDNNDILDGATTPRIAIFSSGTSAAIDNSNNTISNNNIANYFDAANATSGIQLASTGGNSAWTITGNKFYQTANRIYTSAGTHNGINIQMGSGYNISDNIIGFANASGTGTTNMIGLNTGSLGGTFPSAYTAGGTANATRYIGINCAFTAGGTASSIQNNTIAGFALYTSSGAATANGIFCGINITSGNANIGTTTGNNIGTSSASIYTASGNGGAIVGIYASSANTVVIRNNSIQNLNAMGNTSTLSGGITGIATAGTGGNFTVQGNTIGGTSNPNLRMGTLVTGTNLSNIGTTFGVATNNASVNFYGISNLATGTIVIGGAGTSGNTIRNASLNSTSTAGNAVGIYNFALGVTSTTIDNNLINNITAVSLNTGNSTAASVIGISEPTSGINETISNNTISNLNNTNTTTGSFSVVGIATGGTSAGSISGNKVYGISNASTSAAATNYLTGLWMFGSGAWTVSNNMIAVTNGSLTNSIQCRGIFDNSAFVAGVKNYFYNSIYIGGNQTGVTALNSIAFQRAADASVNIRNNIFDMRRTGTAGKFYAIGNSNATPATRWPATASDYNYINAPTVATVCLWGAPGAGDRTFTQWQSGTSSGGDANSITGHTVFYTDITNGDLHLSNNNCVLNDKGTAVSITTDYDATTRSATTPDIGADEFNAVALPTAVSLNGTAAICSGNSTNLTLNITGIPATTAWDAIFTATPSINQTAITSSPVTISVSPAITTTYTIDSLKYGNCYFTTGFTPANVIVTVIPSGTILWNGTTSTNWNTASNWSCGGVPTLSDNVVIATGAPNYPVIASGQFGTCANISLQTGSTVTVTGTGQISLYGNITNTGGVFDVTDGTLNYAGTNPALVLSGATIRDRTVKNLMVSALLGIGAAANNGDTVKVTGFVSFDGSNRTLNTNDNLTLVSNAAGTASIKDATNNSTVSGNLVSGEVNVERFIETNRKWRFLAINTYGASQTIQNSWMEGQTPGVVGVNGRGTWITDPAGTAQGFDATSITASMKYWNGAGYTNVSNPTLFDIKALPAYMIFVRGDRNAQASNATLNTTVLRTKGLIYQNSVPVASVPIFPTILPVPNIYPSAVDLTKLQYSEPGTVTAYVWDPKLTGSQGFGGFQTLSSPDGIADFTIVPGGGSYGAAGSVVNVIESGQGFFIQGVGDPRTITFVERAKTPKERDVFFTQGLEQTLDAQLSIVENNNSTLVDGVRSTFNKKNNSGFDFNDAQKMLNNNENVSIKVADKLLAVERRNIIVSDDTIQLNIANVRLKNYQWKFNLSNLDEPGREAFLLDRFNNTNTALNLNGNNTYNFSIVNTPASYANNRFAIVFKQNAVALPIVKATAARLINGKVAINFNTEKESYVDNYVVEKSTDGINFTSVVGNEDPSNNNGGNANYAATDGNAAIKEVLYYRVFAKRYAGGNVYSNIVKVNADVVDSYVKIYPNPITNKVAQLEIANKPAGNYTVQIADAKGSIVQKATITVVNNLERKKLVLNNTIIAGVYSLMLVAEDGTTSVEKMVVQ